MTDTVTVHIKIEVEAASDEVADRLVEAGILTIDRVEQIRQQVQVELDCWMVEHGFLDDEP
jgi:hypothetical protein